MMSNSLSLMGNFMTKRSGSPPWWDLGVTCVAAYNFQGAASEAEAQTNLADPGQYTLVKVGSPVFTLGSGWSSPTVSDSLTALPSSSTSLTVYAKFTTTATNAGSILTGSTAAHKLRPAEGVNADAFFQFKGGTSYTHPGPTALLNATGTMGLSWTRFFINGVHVGTGGNGFSGSGHFMMQGGGGNTTIHAIAFYQTNISDELVATLHTNMMGL